MHSQMVDENHSTDSHVIDRYYLFSVRMPCFMVPFCKLVLLM